MAVQNPLKIAFSGSAGIGKSTLARAVADCLTLPLIDEHFDEFIDRTDIKNKTARQYGDEFVAILRHKSMLEAQYPGFVSDRCPIDLLHFWSFYRLGASLSAETNRRFLNSCIKGIRAYDFVVLPPWNGIPLVQLGEDRPKAKRNMNGYIQLKHHASIVGFTHMWVDKPKIIEIPQMVREHQQRVAFVLSAMGFDEATVAGLVAERQTS